MILVDPRIDDVYAAMLEIGSVPGRYGRMMGPCNRGDHGVKLGYGAAPCVSRGHNSGKGASGIFVEGEDAARKLLGEDLLDSRHQAGAALTGRQRFNAV